MTAMRTEAAETCGRLTSTFAKSVFAKSVFARSVMAARVLKSGFGAGMIAVFCVVGMARATAEPDQGGLEGRWTADKRKLVLDITRCGANWCGTEVVDGKTCGKTVLTFEQSGPEEHFRGLIGRLELAAEARPYSVQVLFYEATVRDPVRLYINGNPGRRFEPWGRTFLFTEVFARAGDPACTATAPKIS
jgi:uncharacterized protein (DUF2147 family)